MRNLKGQRSVTHTGHIRKEQKRDRYKLYGITLREKLLVSVTGVLIGSAAVWLCYNSFYFSPVGIVIAVVFSRIREKSLMERKRQQLLYHFKDFITSLHTTLRAGYSLENGVVSTVRDMEILFGSDDILTVELKEIVAKMKIRIRVEDLFVDLGNRSGIEDIRMFANLLAICKKTGGNMSKLLSDTSSVICDKIDTKQEIDSIISAKSFEQMIMSLMPAAIILYLKITFKGLLDVLYQDMFGRIVMSICLLVYLAGVYWGRRIVDIKV